MVRARCWGLAFVLVVPCGGHAQSSDVEQLRAENARLRARVTELEAENATLRGRPGGSLAAALEERASGTVAEKPDAETGSAVVATEPSRLERTGGPPSRHWIVLRGARSPAGAPERVEMVIETAASGGMYRDATQLRLVTDGAVAECPVVDYRLEPITQTRPNAGLSARETIVASVPLPALARMAAAREVKGTLGTMTFRLTPEQLATVRAFRRRLEG